MPREQPEASGNHQRREEVREVHDPRRVVDPVDPLRVPQVLLQPDGRHEAEQELVGAELRPDVRLEEPVRVAAKQVVREQHERERQPVDQDAAAPAAQIGEAGGEEPQQDPEHQRVSRGGQPAERDREPEGHEVRDRPDPGEARPRKPALPGPCGAGRVRPSRTPCGRNSRQAVGRYPPVWCLGPQALEAFLLGGRPFGRRERLQPLVGIGSPLSTDSPYVPSANSGLRARDGLELGPQLASQPGVQLVLRELGSLVTEVLILVGELAGVLWRKPAQRA